MRLWANKPAALKPPVDRALWRVAIEDATHCAIFENDARGTWETTSDGTLKTTKRHAGYMSLSITMPDVLYAPSDRDLFYALFGRASTPKQLAPSARMALCYQDDAPEFIPPYKTGADDLIAVFKLSPAAQVGLGKLWIDVIYHGDACGDMMWRDLRIERRARFIL